MQVAISVQELPQYVGKVISFEMDEDGKHYMKFTGIKGGYVCGTKGAPHYPWPAIVEVVPEKLRKLTVHL